jgi:DNA-directed RNA polymerase specialized sigma24 family protein
MKGIDRFDACSTSLRTWCVRILGNQPVSRARREGRIVPFSAVAAADASPAGSPSLPADRFHDIDHPTVRDLQAMSDAEEALLIGPIR